MHQSRIESQAKAMGDIRVTRDRGQREMLPKPICHDLADPLAFHNAIYICLLDKKMSPGLILALSCYPVTILWIFRVTCIPCWGWITDFLPFIPRTSNAAAFLSEGGIIFRWHWTPATKLTMTQQFCLSLMLSHCHEMSVSIDGQMYGLIIADSLIFMRAISSKLGSDLSTFVWPMSQIGSNWSSCDKGHCVVLISVEGIR